MTGPAEAITNVTAGAAIVSPWWLPTITFAADASTFLLPVLGVVWLAVQIIAKVRSEWFNKRGK